MREPVWEALHWALVGLGLLGLGLLAWRRRWEALVLATVFLAITALSALLVASPRRVLVMVPLSRPRRSARWLESPQSASALRRGPTAQSWSYLTWKVSLMKVAVSAPLKVHL